MIGCWSEIACSVGAEASVVRLSCWLREAGRARGNSDRTSPADLCDRSRMVANFIPCIHLAAHCSSWVLVIVAHYYNLGDGQVQLGQLINCSS